LLYTSIVIHKFSNENVRQLSLQNISIFGEISFQIQRYQAVGEGCSSGEESEKNYLRKRPD